jgi:hypothetical protein
MQTAQSAAVNLTSTHRIGCALPCTMQLCGNAALHGTALH